MLHWDCLFKAVAITFGAILIGSIIIASVIGLITFGENHPKLGWGLGISILLSLCILAEYFVCLGH